MSWINICDVPLESDYKVAIIKGFVTMMVIFVLGFIIGKFSSPLTSKMNKGVKK